VIDHNFVDPGIVFVGIVPAHLVAPMKKKISKVQGITAPGTSKLG
jgi:hypothetical protein